VTVDGTLIRTDRCRAPGPTARADRPDRRVDLWWSGKHAAHGGNVQVIAAPDGWPLWTSDVRPGREHDTTALRTHPEALPLLAAWTDDEHAARADLGCEGERTALTTPIKRSAELHAAVRSPAERGNSLLKTSFKALRRVSLCPRASVPSPPPPWGCSTTSTTAPHDHRPVRAVTGNGSMTDSPCA
jgi:hypothetical protein